MGIYIYACIYVHYVENCEIRNLWEIDPDDLVGKL